MSSQQRHATMAALDALWTRCEGDETVLRRIQDMVQLLVDAHGAPTLDAVVADIVPNRGMGLGQEIQTFIQVFLSKQRFYYHNSAYYAYDGVNYAITTDGDVAHAIVSAISRRGGALMDYKPRIKTATMKQIKDRSLFKSIPETETIQSVLQALIPAVAESKSAAKYFLTVLGDCIIRKTATRELVYYVTPSGRKLLDRIASLAQPHMSISCGNFVTKHHSTHEFARCRVVKLAPSWWRSETAACAAASYPVAGTSCAISVGNIVNLLCVAAHYACRGTGDEYLHACGDKHLADTALTLARHTPEQLVTHFCDQYIVAADPSTRLTVKQMTYVWRAFLVKSCLPNVIYTDRLMDILKTMYAFDVGLDAFMGITSGDLLQMDLFARFWEQHMRPYDVSEFDNELEIDEICAAIRAKRASNPKGCDIQMTEADVVRLIHHFFPAITVLDEKYVLHWSCDLIDKAGDVRRAVEEVRQNGLSGDGLVQFDDVYLVYCSSASHKSVRLASKRYFYKYMQVFYASYVVYDEFLSRDFFLL